MSITAVHNPPTNPTGPQATPSRTVLCPACGYDLRATTGERCSECGWTIDREALKRSALPWAHRKSVGRFRAFLKTIWLVTADSNSLRHETAKAQSPRDATAFGRWVAVLLALLFAGIVALVVHEDALRDIVVRPPSARFPTWQLNGLQQDILVPWSAGVTMPWALFAYATALAFYTAAAPRSLFRTRGLTPEYAETVRAIGGYCCAPLMLALPAAALYAGTAWLAIVSGEVFRRNSALPLVLVGVAFGLLFAAVGGTVYRTAQWRARTTHGGFATGLLAIAELLLRWAVGCAVVLGVVPWCVGFIRIVADSLR